MGIAFDTKKRREYVPLRERQKPAAEQLVYVLRALDVFDRAELADLRTKGMGPARATLELVRLGLDGWRNLQLPGGAPAEFATRADGRASDDTIRLVPDADAAEIVTDLMAWEEVALSEAGE